MDEEENILEHFDNLMHKSRGDKLNQQRLIQLLHEACEKISPEDVSKLSGEARYIYYLNEAMLRVSEEENTHECS